MHAVEHTRSAADLTLMTAPSSTGRVRQAVPFVAIGVGCVIVGGLTAAVNAHAPTEHAAWAAAYLVLVAGLAQVALGLGRAWLSEGAPTVAQLGLELAVWNLGNAAVIAGTLSELTVLTDAGGALLVVALVLLGRAATRARDRASGRGPGWVRTGYLAVISVLAVSIPIGLVLAALNT